MNRGGMVISRSWKRGEFDWSSLEPKEGTYPLDWLERAIRSAERHHIAVVLDTPGPRRRPG
jgi:beta-galactosidase GanA